MNVTRFNPFNWFRKEQETQGSALPVRRETFPSPETARTPWLELHHEMDRLFENFARQMDFGLPSVLSDAPIWTSASMLPKTDIAESETQYTISVELPGVTEKDVNVELVGDTLRISGEKKQESEEKRRNYHRLERHFGSFQRIVNLPEDADTESIDACFRNGVMTIAIPRKAGLDPATRKVDVKTA